MNAVRKTFARKTLTAAVTALSLAGMVAATTTEASAGWRGRHHGGGWGGPVAAGVVGALALGAFAAAASPRHYGPQGYYPVAGYDPVQCYVENQPAYDAWGQFAGYRAVRVCQ